MRRDPQVLPRLRSWRRGPSIQAIRSAAVAHPRRGKRGASDYRLNVEQRPPRIDGIVPLAFGAVFCAFTLLVLYLARGSDAPLTAVLTVGISFCGVGAGLIVLGLRSLFLRDSLLIENDRLSFERRGFLGGRSFDEALSSYLCILPFDYVRTNQQSATVSFYARLVHGEDPAKDLALLLPEKTAPGLLPLPMLDREALEALARDLDLPLGTVAWDRSVTLRNPDELDEPLRPAAQPELGPFPGRRFRVTQTAEGFVAEQSYRGYLLPFALLALIAAAVWFGGGGSGNSLPVALVLSALSLFMLASSFTRNRLTVTASAATRETLLFGLSFQRSSIPLAEVEELVDGRDPQSRARSLLIVSDKATIAWAWMAKTAEIAWFKSAIERCMAQMSEDASGEKAKRNIP